MLRQAMRFHIFQRLVALGQSSVVRQDVVQADQPRTVILAALLQHGSCLDHTRFPLTQNVVATTLHAGHQDPLLARFRIFRRIRSGTKGTDTCAGT